MPAKSATAKPEAKPKVSGSASLWARYRVRFNFLTKLCGSVPADPELIQKWLDVQKPSVRPAGGRTIQEINEEVLASLERGEEEPQFSMLVFQRHEGHLVQRAGTVKAHIKDCASQVSSLHVGRIQGEKSYAVKIKNGVYHDEREYWLPIRRADGAFITDADGAYDKPIHVRTPQGQMNALKRFEFIEPPSYLEFTLKAIAGIAEDDLHLLFEYGGTHGYAGERGDGEGRYSYTLERIGA